MRDDQHQIFGLGLRVAQMQHRPAMDRTAAARLERHAVSLPRGIGRKLDRDVGTAALDAMQRRHQIDER